MVSSAEVRLGDLRVVPLGVGTWAWGTKRLWGYGGDYDERDLEAAFRTSLEAGITLFDTAEIYGSGASERILGRLIRKSGEEVVVATKFAPLPYRLGARSLLKAVQGSRERLGIETVDLYQVHFPSPLLSIERLMDALAEAVKRGWVRNVGVSNYGAGQMFRAARRLERHGIPLASNQVHYSLLHRAPERNGVLDACRELGAVLIAYSPLAQGLLTGKYRPGVRAAGGLRRLDRRFRRKGLERIRPVVDLLRRVGEAHGGRTPAQVALNWLAMRDGVLPIPGAKNERQARENAGALGWRMSEDEFHRLERATRAL
ncbi:aldo/keto reductase [Rubrobacter taiwanensis]|jgi:aryl-alcohol dehydrogenase-like predicted oxidoreductase|uniref:Aldo/keto reductase n=1 Tax=Rubrobacter taiwanensis TaxID=185139 RepID=A0A4R1BR99_9ACTN|nr:aldo/keto reductase [Rubrobacter taiwanensis]TCJ19715.1 aldo/keto reductase [Rubrobacter taiwanensis]